MIWRAPVFPHTWDVQAVVPFTLEETRAPGPGEALLRQVVTLSLSFREQRCVQNYDVAEFILHQLLHPSF
jgi:hypothetical protein